MRSRHALTLIELLVAMGIAVLLVGVVFAIYAGVLRTLDFQGRWRARAYPVSAALDALALDLAGAVMPWGITNAPFILAVSPDGGVGIKLHFFTTTPMSIALPRAAQYQSLSGQCVYAYAIREIDYSIAASKTMGTNGLIRSWSTFRIDNPVGLVSNQDIWESVRAIQLEVFDGNQWANTWGGGTNFTLPRAARITLNVGDESVSPFVTEVLIPAGQRIAAPKSRKLKTN